MADEAAAAPRTSRLVGIEGLRALAASSVVAYHVWLYGAANGQSVDLGALSKVFANLRSGVTLFFVLSGFLLFRPYAAAALRGLPTPGLRNYLRNRALRIAPAYWVVLVFVALGFEHTLLRHPDQLAANLFLLQNYVPSFIFGAGIVPAWSLAIEIVFYLCVPILGGTAIVLARRRGASPVVAAFAPVLLMTVLGLASKGVTRVAHPGDVWTFSFATHADWFAAGMAVAVLRIRWEDGMLRLPRFWRPTALVSALALVAVAIKLYYGGTLDYVEYQTPIAMACGLILALVVFAEPRSRLIRVLTWRPIVSVGLASYSLFLWHDPLLRELRSAGLTLDGRSGFLVNLLLVFALAGVASTLTYLFVEKPALARKRGWQRGAVQRLEAPREPDLTAAAAAAARGG
jgi:peptidoglycan/LPS O-acetylase OafA/YrhL